MKYFILFFAFSFSLSFAQVTPISDFNSINDWKIVHSDGAEISISNTEGFSNNSLKLNFNFTGAGWCGIEKDLNISLPDDYKFSYFIKGEGLKNNLEFKLIDSTGDNVWWFNQRNFELPQTWQKEIVRKRNIQFAWGPKGGGEIIHPAKIQIIIAASEGGKGSVFLDELVFEEAAKQDTTIPIKITASSPSDNSGFVIDGNPETAWQTDEKNNQQLRIDFGYVKEFGGIIINWMKNRFAKDFSISISKDGKNFNTVFAKNNGRGTTDFIFIKNGEARFIDFNLNESAGTGFGISEIEIKPLEFSDHPNNFFQSAADHYPKGYFPKYFSRTQSFWNIIGISGDLKEGLINEEGSIEVDKASFSISPFLFVDDKFLNWNEVELEQSLDSSYLPIPSVLWKEKNIDLNIKAFAAGEKDESLILIQYKIINKSDTEKNINLYLAIRPFQVNAPWQFLNVQGGAAKINKISADNSFVSVDKKKLFFLTNYNNFGASQFKDGEIVTFIDQNSLPDTKEIYDSLGFGSGAAVYNLKLNPGEEKNVYVAIPFYDNYPQTLENIKSSDAENFFKEKLNEVSNYWTDRLNRVEINLPPDADKLINTLKSNLAYILINRDGPAIQPGSRSYERAWIRDGALTSGALLRLGIKDEVKEYLDWYSQFQFPNGKIPCVVDKRGADPTPENDSHGEYIFAILQYFNFSKDTSFLRDKFETISKTVDYIEYLTSQRKTAQYKKEDSLAFYGLMPESISHEGYSAKPMHSYWDDFFTLRGLKDAATIASILNEAKEKERFILLRDEFEKNLYNSINLAMKNHNINYIPGCVELGDFDATSTTISIFPGNELGNLPQPELNNTFEIYYDNFVQRKNYSDWTAYTPYEIRAAGSFLYLGKKEKTFELLDYFFHHQFPYAWNHWAEVVWNNNTPGFIGDMPHTWIGSDYINVVRSMFVFEREYDSSLVVGLGLKKEWADHPDGISIKNLSTFYGVLNYSIKKDGNNYLVRFNGDLEMPAGKLILENFTGKKPNEVLINGSKSKHLNEKEIIVNEFPAEIILKY